MQKVKTTLKYVLVVIMLCVMLLLCCSCAEVQNITIVNDDGTIDEMVYVYVDKQQLEEKDCDYAHTKELIESKASITAQVLCENFENKLNLEIFMAESAEVKMFLTSLKGGVTAIGNTWEDDVYKIGLRFKNANVYRHFYNITSTEREISEVENHFLYTKVKYYGLSFYADGRYTAIYDVLATQFNAEFEGKFVDVEDTKLYFTYTTTERREHSDADMIFKANGKYYHTWEIIKNQEAEQGEEFYQVLTLYYNVANTGNCILCCIIFSLMLSVILLLICVIIKKCKNKRKIFKLN